MSKLNILLILSIILLLVSMGLVINSMYENYQWRRSIVGATEIGSTTYRDYEVVDLEFLCEICQEFYCDRGLKGGCEYCNEKC